jgi:hypothetical protein
MRPMLSPSPLRPLTIDPAFHPRAQPHLSAASGLVCAHGRVHVVADDELHLGVFDDAAAPGRLIRLFDGALPADKKARKRAKPDLETLLHLPPGPGWPQGALLALGSGSRPQRERGALLTFEKSGHIVTAARSIDLAPLYGPLRLRFDDLNIEGAFVLAGDLVLLQRGNGRRGVNAALHYRWADVQSLLRGEIGAGLIPRAEHRFTLGDLDGVPLGFTDGVAWPGPAGAGRWLFTAAAEDTDNSYLDGGCAGSVLGLADAQGRLLWMRPLAGRHKVEGIDARAEPGGLALCLVTDADDPAQASVLWRAWMDGLA